MIFFTTNIFIIKLSSFIGFFFVLTSIILFIIIMIKRFYLIRKQKRDERLLEEWRSILLKNLYGVPAPFKNIPKKNISLFLILWNNLQDILKGPEKEQLSQLARSLHINHIALTMLSSRKLSKRLLAISVLGNLREKKAWSRLHEFAKSENMTLAITAIHALAKIDPEKSVTIVISFMVHRQDWPNYRLVVILSEIGAGRFSNPLANEIRLLPSLKQPRLLNMMNFGDGKVVLPLVKQLLAATHNNEVISSCLNLLSIFGDHRDVPIVKAYLNHKEAFIRMWGVKTLASIGNESDLLALERCLSDRDWWVRYRAAEAIKLLPTTTDEKILEIRSRQSDRFAIDILNYVIS
ncbi:MAG: heat repeat protein [Clostridia bacterium]|nr:heat repeat protein [Clostridia bacterium]